MLFPCTEEFLLNDFRDPATNGNRLEPAVTEKRTGVKGPVTYTGYCLDVQEGKNEDGTPVQLWRCTRNNRNQRWVFA